MLKARQTRRNGYSEIVDGITQGVSGVGYAFSLSQITRVAISFGAINPRLDAARRKQMGELLARECKAWVQARQQAGA